MDTRMKLGLLLAVLALIAIGIAVAGCQTCRGVAADIGRVCEDVKGQIPPQEND